MALSNGNKRLLKWAQTWMIRVYVYDNFGRCGTHSQRHTTWMKYWMKQFNSYRDVKDIEVENDELAEWEEYSYLGIIFDKIF